jgi:hypothetical protein
MRETYDEIRPPVSAMCRNLRTFGEQTDSDRRSGVKKRRFRSSAVPRIRGPSPDDPMDRIGASTRSPPYWLSAGMGSREGMRRWFGMIPSLDWWRLNGRRCMLRTQGVSEL